MVSWGEGSVGGESRGSMLTFEKGALTLVTGFKGEKNTEGQMKTKGEVNTKGEKVKYCNFNRSRRD